MIIDRPLEIVGEGRRSDTVIQNSNGSTVIVAAKDVRLLNLTVRQQGGQGWHAIDVAEGSATIEQCELTSDSSDCVMVRESNSVELRGSVVGQSPQCAVRLLAGSTVMMSDSELKNSGAAGLLANENCVVDVSRSSVIFNRGDGISVTSTARQVVIRYSRFVGNLGNAIALHGDSISANIQDNELQGCGQAGVLVGVAGDVVVERNSVSASAAGIRLLRGATPMVSLNHISEIRGNGIEVGDHSAGILEQNDVSDCLLFGLLVSGASRPIIRNNRISQCERGMGVVEESQGEIMQNEIRDNRTDGVTFRSNASPVFVSNRVLGNASDGIYIIGGAGGNVLENIVENNSGDGIVVKGISKPIIQGNRIANNGNHGIYIHDGGGGILRSNRVAQNGSADVKIAEDCQNHVVVEPNAEPEPASP